MFDPDRTDEFQDNETIVVWKNCFSEIGKGNKCCESSIKNMY
jgi:hypothetical protein